MSDDRQYWLDTLTRLATPVLTAAAAGELHARMPVEAQPGLEAERAHYAHLEVLGRLLAGLAPWLESEAGGGEEVALRGRFRGLAQEALRHATDPASPDYCNFTQGGQPLVDGAFLAHAMLRAPRQLGTALPGKTQAQVLDALELTRVIKPRFSNWLLFAAMVEAALARGGRGYDVMRVDYAVRQHEQWYKGDGVYGDGPAFHFDYYNSFVIQPMFIDVLAAFGPLRKDWAELEGAVVARGVRYGAVLERMIGPDGSFPAVGRSMAYRCGAFQHLAQMALQGQLPAGVSGAQVRCGLTAVMRRTLDAAGTYDEQGWLRIGLAGHQLGLGEGYISTGSLYLCATVLLPLGLGPEDPFWAGAEEAWTQKKVWSGQNVVADHAL